MQFTRLIGNDDNKEAPKPKKKTTFSFLFDPSVFSMTVARRKNTESLGLPPEGVNYFDNIGYQKQNPMKGFGRNRKEVVGQTKRRNQVSENMYGYGDLHTAYVDPQKKGLANSEIVYPRVEIESASGSIKDSDEICLVGARAPEGKILVNVGNIDECIPGAKLPFADQSTLWLPVPLTVVKAAIAVQDEKYKVVRGAYEKAVANAALAALRADDEDAMYHIEDRPPLMEYQVLKAVSENETKRETGSLDVSSIKWVGDLRQVSEYVKQVVGDNVIRTPKPVYVATVNYVGGEVANFIIDTKGKEDPVNVLSDKLAQMGEVLAKARFNEKKWVVNKETEEGKYVVSQRTVLFNPKQMVERNMRKASELLFEDTRTRLWVQGDMMPVFGKAVQRFAENAGIKKLSRQSKRQGPEEQDVDLNEKIDKVPTKPNGAGASTKKDCKL